MDGDKMNLTSPNGGPMRKPWEEIGVSRATWYRRGKPTTKPSKITQAQAAKLMNVSVRSVQRAVRVARISPELAYLVEIGRIKLGFAEHIVRDPDRLKWVNEYFDEASED